MTTPRPISKPSEPSGPPDSPTRTAAECGDGQSETVSPQVDPRLDVKVRYDFLAPPQAPEEIGRLGPFVVLGLLGAGGMGIVFRAADPHLNRQVALKVILPEHAPRPHARERFLREGRAVAAVEHLHVVPIFHVGEDHGVPYLVMPLLKGELLAQALKRDPRPPLPELVRIGREMAEGLAAAHAQHLIHRDIKPGNVWLEGAGRWVRLLDFGLARPDEATAIAEEPLTASGQFVGTPVYMSPEQARGESVTVASDLFSLGVVLYQMATGVLPFAGSTTMAVLTALATRTPDPPTALAPALPPALDALIMRLLAKDPARRPSSAQAVADALRQIEATLPPMPQAPAVPAITVIAAAPPTMTAIATRSEQRRRASLWAVAGLLLLVGAGFLAQQQIRITTPKGTLVIDADDPNVEIVVKKDGAVILDKTRDRALVLEVGDYTIELSEKKDGLKLSTDRFSITRNGTETVKVWLEKPEPLPADFQRKVLEWVLKQQDAAAARVRLDSGAQALLRPSDLIPKDLKALEDLRIPLSHPEVLSAQVAAWLRALPADCVVAISLSSGDWNDAALGRLITQVEGVSNLRLQIRAPAPITDQGLHQLLKLPRLRGIHLVNLKVSDVAVRELENLSRLQHLQFSQVPITDKTVEALLHRGACLLFVLEGGTQATELCLPAILKNTNLGSLGLVGIPLRDDDLRSFTRLKQLGTFYLWGPFITNESARLLEPLPFLRELRILHCEQVDDGVFDHLGSLRQLTNLWLHRNEKITNAGLAKVKDLPKLTRLYLSDSAGITADGVASLRAALPKLTVVWDGDAKKSVHGSNRQGRGLEVVVSSAAKMSFLAGKTHVRGGEP